MRAHRRPWVPALGMTALSVGLLLIGAGRATAHGGRDERIKILVRPDSIHLEVSIDAAVLSSFDRDGDGLLRVREVHDQTKEIGRWLDEQITVTSDAEALHAPTFSDLPIEGFSSLTTNDPVAHVKMIRRYPLTGKETRVQVDWSLADPAGRSRRFVVWQDGQARTGQVRSDRSESIVLLPQAESSRLVL